MINSFNKNKKFSSSSSSSSMQVNTIENEKYIFRTNLIRKKKIKIKALV